MRRAPFLTLCAATAVLLLQPGCAGYQLGSVKPAAFADVEKIHVPIFRNDTLEPRLSSLVSNAVLKQLQADGTYQVTNRSSSDAVLVGKIRNVRKRQLRAVRTDTLTSQELSVYLELEFHLEDPNTGEKLGTRSRNRDEPGDPDSDSDPKKESTDPLRVPQGRVVGETIQFVESNFQVSERAALSRAAEDAAKKLVSQIANGW